MCKCIDKRRVRNSSSLLGSKCSPAWSHSTDRPKSRAPNSHDELEHEILEMILEIIFLVLIFFTADFFPLNRVNYWNVLCDKKNAVLSSKCIPIIPEVYRNKKNSFYLINGVSKILLPLSNYCISQYETNKLRFGEKNIQKFCSTVFKKFHTPIVFCIVFWLDFFRMRVSLWQEENIPKKIERGTTGRWSFSCS